MPVTAALIAGGASVAGGLLESSGQTAANRSNERIAKENRDFQERMSSTAYQRASKDLSAAGLNRILALGSPASTPGGALAVMQNTKAGIGKGISNAGPLAINTALAVKKTTSEIASIDAQTKSTQATEANTLANTALINTRQLTESHGEVVASVYADIVRTLKIMSGNLTPEEMAVKAKQLINEYAPQIKRYIEQMGGSAKEVQNRLQQSIDGLTGYVFDYFNEPVQLRPRGQPPTKWDEFKKWSDTPGPIPLIFKDKK